MAPNELALVLVLLCLFFLPSLSRFAVEKNSLSILSPDHLKGIYDSAIAKFGIPDGYPGSLSGILFFPKYNSKGCMRFQSSHLYRSHPGSMPSFLIVDRGGCYLAQKVLFGQQAGAAAVLVVDDTVEPLIAVESPVYPVVDKNLANILNNITIPSAFIEKKLGDALKVAIQENEIVNLELDWHQAVPHPNPKVEYQISTNSNDECGAKCDTQINSALKNFKGAAQLREQESQGDAMILRTVVVNNRQSRGMQQ